MAEIQGSHGRTGTGPYMKGRSIVAIRFGGRRIGLYRVKQVGEAGMLLNHGGISFPVGTQLDVEDVRRSAPDSAAAIQAATVVDNTPGGLSLVWRARQAGDSQ